MGVKLAYAEIFQAFTLREDTLDICYYLVYTKKASFFRPQRGACVRRVYPFHPRDSHILWMCSPPRPCRFFCIPAEHFELEYYPLSLAGPESRGLPMRAKTFWTPGYDACLLAKRIVGLRLPGDRGNVVKQMS